MKRFFKFLSLMLFVAVSFIAFQPAAQAGECITCHTAVEVDGFAFAPLHIETAAQASADRTMDIFLMPTTAGQSVGAIVPVANLFKTTGEYKRQVDGDISASNENMKSKSLYASAVAFMPLPDH